MSAWIVSKTHIDLLVTAGHWLERPDGFTWYHETGATLRHRHRKLTYANHHEVGQMLWAENLASVRYRYPDDVSGERPGPNDFADDDVLRYRFEEIPGMLTLAAIAKNVACYEYQSCEHPGWKTSSAYAYCQAINDALLNRLPGYDQAPWGFDDRTYFLNQKEN